MISAPVLVRVREMIPASMLRHHWAVLSTAWGNCGVVWRTVGDRGVEATPFATSQASLLQRIVTPGSGVTEIRTAVLRALPQCQEVLADRNGHFHPEIVPTWFGELQHFLQAYYSNALRDITQAWANPDGWAYWHSHLDWDQLTAFQRSVLTVVGKIAHGTVLTYGDVARKIGKPNAVRAVGGAIGANPWPVLVPCHRVIGTSGKLVGFSAPGGVATKKRMLEMEQGGCFDLRRG